jgi:rhodanese-related sulfurtransferase
VDDTPLTRVLRRAEARVARLSPSEAAAAQADGAVIVDTRSHEDRARDGVVPGSLHIPRTVLEWRLDPGGRWRTPHVAVDDRLVIVCSDGCSSLLAAASLLDLGLDARDVVGGMRAWRAAGLPLVPPDASGGAAHGAGPPGY